jgi:hypothetical protein
MYESRRTIRDRLDNRAASEANNSEALSLGNDTGLVISVSVIFADVSRRDTTTRKNLLDA